MKLSLVGKNGKTIIFLLLWKKDIFAVLRIFHYWFNGFKLQLSLEIETRVALKRMENKYVITGHYFNQSNVKLLHTK